MSCDLHEELSVQEQLIRYLVKKNDEADINELASATKQERACVRITLHRMAQRQIVMLRKEKRRISGFCGRGHKQNIIIACLHPGFPDARPRVAR